MINRIVAYSAAVIAIITLGTGCAGTSTGTSTVSSTACPSELDEYKQGVSTAADVKRCLGKPVHEDRNPDGRFVYVYNPDEKNDYILV